MKNKILIIEDDRESCVIGSGYVSLLVNEKYLQLAKNSGEKAV